MNIMANVKVHLRTRRGNVNIMLLDLEFSTCPVAQKYEHEKELLAFLRPSDLFMSSKTIIGVMQNKKV